MGVLTVIAMMILLLSNLLQKVVDTALHVVHPTVAAKSACSQAFNISAGSKLCSLHIHVHQGQIQIEVAIAMRPGACCQG